MTTTYEALRTTLDALEKKGIDPPGVTFSYHGVEPETAKAIIRSLPEFKWGAAGNAGTVWVTGYHEGVSVHVYPRRFPPAEDPNLVLARELVAEAEATS